MPTSNFYKTQQEILCVLSKSYNLLLCLNDEKNNKEYQ